MSSRPIPAHALEVDATTLLKISVGLVTVYYYSKAVNNSCKLVNYTFIPSPRASYLELMGQSKYYINLYPICKLIRCLPNEW